MKTMALILMAFLAVVPMAASGQSLVKEYHNDNSDRDNNPLDITVWLDHKDGVYYEGDNVTIYFQASQDCYVALYSIDTKGNLSLLYPAENWDDGFVRGGEEYAVPAENSNYDLIVAGPEGIESIQAVASGERMNIPDWSNGSPERADYDTDRDHFVQYINDHYFGCRWDDCARAFSSASIYVKGSQYYYRPVYVPPTWLDYPDYSCIYVDYPFGGEIYIDGIFIGIAPCWIPRVMFGWHWFTIYDHYGYCWEDRLDCRPGHTINLDHSRIKTDRTAVSRFKDIRTQATKFNRSNLVLSDTRVKSVRIDEKGMAARPYHSDQTGQDSRSGGMTKRTANGSASDRVFRKTGTSRAIDQWNTPRQSQPNKESKTGGNTVHKESARTQGQATPSSGSKQSRGSEVKQSTPSTKRSTGSSTRTAPSRPSPSNSGNKGRSESLSQRPRSEPVAASHVISYHPQVSTGQPVTGRTSGGGYSAPAPAQKSAPVHPGGGRQRGR